MSNRIIKSIEAVATMIKLTQDGEMLWKEKNPTDLPISKRDPFEYIDSVFETEYLGKILRLYRRNYKIERQERRDILPILLGRKEPKDKRWGSEVILEIVGENNRALWTFPDVNALNDLFLSVQYQAAGVKDFFDHILAR